jgi:hypothetical protein
VGKPKAVFSVFLRTKHRKPLENRNGILSNKKNVNNCGEHFSGAALPPVKASAARVARWCIFKPKIPIWINFGGSYNERCWYILGPFGLFQGHLVYFEAVLSTLWPFGIFFPFWYVAPRKIWQPCLRPYRRFKPKRFLFLRKFIFFHFTTFGANAFTSFFQHINKAY